MILVPEIGSVEATGSGVRLDFAVPATLDYFEGHFPDCPLLPGVVQIGWALELARRHVPRLPVDARFRSLAAVKFTRVIQPGATLTLMLAFEDTRRELSFEYQLAGETCSSGRALLQ